MAKWRDTILGEVCDEVDGIIQTGPFGSQLHESDYSPEGIPVVMPKDIIEGRISTDSVARVLPEHAERLSRHKLQKGDIVYGRRGDIGRQALIRQEQEGWMCGTGCLRISLGESVLNPLFLHYYLRQEDVVSWITNQAVGATMPNLNTGILRTVPVSFPPLPEQRRIAGILSAYDELIENSQRRITILEAMARALYREWFIHFRYPGSGRDSGNEPSSRPGGHPSPKGGREDTELPLRMGEDRGEGAQLEKVKRVPSPIGEIPKGWEVKKLGELTKFLNRGLSPSYDDNGELVVINQKCIRDQRLSLEPARRQTKPIPQDKLVRFGDVLINSTGVGTLGRVAQVYEALSECTVDTHVTIARPNAETDLDFFGCTLLLQQETFDRLGVGATGQTELSRTAIANVDLVVPSTRIQRRFGEVVRPMRTAAMNHAKQIQNLRRTRDLLLPRLLTGQVNLGDY